MPQSFRWWRWLGALTLVAVGLLAGVSAAGAQSANGVQGAAAVSILPRSSDAVSAPTLSGGGWAHPHSVSSAQLHTEPPQFVTPPRPHVGGVQNAAASLNWSGQYATGTTFSEIQGEWKVPTVQPTQATEASGTWIGIDDGSGSSDGDIIQTGTGQLAQGGSTEYYAWYELYPAPPVILGQVAPGDQMEAEIVQSSGTAWTIEIVDVTESVGGPIDVTYSGPATTGEWIEEVPTAASGPQPYLANFGSVTFTGLGITPADPSAAVITPLDIVDGDGNVISSTGAITPAPAFTITYVPEPTTTVISAGPAQSAAGQAVTYSATVQSPGPPPTGTVAFTDGGTALCTATISNGAGSCSATNTPVGNGTVTGQYSGDANSGPSSGTTNVVVTPHGYWLVGSDGGIFTFGSAQFYGSTGSLSLQRPVVGITPTASANGYWLVASDGGIFSFDTGFYGSIPGLGLHPAGSGQPHSLNAPIVGMVPTANGGGYFMVASDGGVFSFGDAKFEGSCPGIGGCAGKAVAVAPDASGNGYWVVTATGNIYTFGDAAYFGAPGPQSSAITSMVRTPNGQGYWILDADGQVFPYGNAAGLGSVAPNTTGGLNPATAIAATSDGGGYWVASASGAVYNFGDAPNDGSMLGTHLNGAIIAATGF